MSEDRISIRSQVVTVDADEVRRQVQHPPRLGTRIKHWFVGVEIASIGLSYKPFYTFEIVLRDEGYFGDDAKEGFIVVDAVTGIARARPEGYADSEEISVLSDSIVARELDVKDALEAAQSFCVKLEHRENRETTLEEMPNEVYKPIWVVSLETDDQCVVDGVSGEIFSDVTLRQLLPFYS